MGAAAPVAPSAPRRDARFRQQLLAKLPPLAYTGWSAKDNFRIDEEWNSVVNLQADAVLGPLERVAPERLR